MVFFEQILDVVHAADVCHLQQLSDLLSSGVFFRGTILSSHMLYLLCAASILHHVGGLHKIWDSLKNDFGFRRFLTRGKGNIRTKLFFLALAFGLKKLWQKREHNRLKTRVSLKMVS